MYIKCPVCQNQVQEGCRFCPNCGAALAKEQNKENPAPANQAVPEKAAPVPPKTEPDTLGLRHNNIGQQPANVNPRFGVPGAAPNPPGNFNPPVMSPPNQQGSGVQPNGAYKTQLQGGGYVPKESGKKKKTAMIVIFSVLGAVILVLGAIFALLVFASFDDTFEEESSTVASSEEVREEWKAQFTAVLDSENKNAEKEKYTVNQYLLYDVDKDGVPELFVNTDKETAISELDLYTYVKGGKEAKYSGSLADAEGQICGSSQIYDFFVHSVIKDKEVIRGYTFKNGALIFDVLFDDRYETPLELNAIDYVPNSDRTLFDKWEKNPAESNFTAVEKYVGYKLDGKASTQLVVDDITGLVSDADCLFADWMGFQAGDRKKMYPNLRDKITEKGTDYYRVTIAKYKTYAQIEQAGNVIFGEKLLKDFSKEYTPDGDKLYGNMYNLFIERNKGLYVQYSEADPVPPPREKMLLEVLEKTENKCRFNVSAFYEGAPNGAETAEFIIEYKDDRWVFTKYSFLGSCYTVGEVVVWDDSLREQNTKILEGSGEVASTEPAPSTQAPENKGLSTQELKQKLWGLWIPSNDLDGNNNIIADLSFEFWIFREKVSWGVVPGEVGRPGVITGSRLNSDGTYSIEIYYEGTEVYGEWEPAFSDEIKVKFSGNDFVSYNYDGTTTLWKYYCDDFSGLNLS